MTCPKKEDKSPICPLNIYRKLPVKSKNDLTKSLTEAKIDDYLEHHYQCSAN